MTGLVDLVPVAELLEQLTGNKHRASKLAAAIVDRGAAALPRGAADIHTATREQLQAAGVLTAGGVATAARAAELLIVCELLAHTATPAPPDVPEPRLVLAAPAGMAKVADVERLDALVLDVIRQATTSLYIGGAFWNDEGFDLLNQTLLPALATRQLPTFIYCNVPKPDQRRSLDERLAELVATGPVRVLWYTGPAPTMLHAKFVVGDQLRGYLGTANLTSWGMSGRHIEAGVELTVGQCERLVRFLNDLTDSGMFSTDVSSQPPRRR